MCIKIANHKVFDGFIMWCIFLNTIVLALSWYEQGETMIKITQHANTVFVVIFSIEAIIKIVAMKCAYF